jgi:cysteine desulfurase
MPVYLDHNATSPPHPDVLAAAVPLLTEHWGNSGSSHALGRIPHQRVEAARRQLAEWAGARPRDVVFTSGATEANNLALRSVPGRLLHSAAEHPSVSEPGLAVDAHVVGVTPSGLVDLDALSLALEQGDVGLVSILFANNETGVLQDAHALHALTQAHGALLHLDCAQMVGRHAAPTAWDLLTVTGHKAGGLKGAGALIVRPGLTLDPMVVGGGQERGRRAGTLNPAPVVSLGVVAGLQHPPRIKALRDRLEAGVIALGGTVVGADAPRLWNTCNAYFSDVPGDHLVVALDLAGVCVSGGATCGSGAAKASPVLAAMGIAHRSVRFSLGWSSTEQDVDVALEALGDALARWRKGSA